MTDAETMAGIGGATVDCGTGGKANTRATDGAYWIGDVPAGTYTCTASATGYSSESQSVTVKPGHNTTANFALRSSG